MSTTVHPTHDLRSSAWQRWLEHPEKAWVHRMLFQIHLWVGMLAGMYVFVMSISGSAIVFRNELEANTQSRLFNVVEWLVDLHENLLFGAVGRAVNGFGAMFLTLLCLTGAIIWWPGIAHWRRSLSMNWRASFARLNWDLHNVLGFWCFLFVLLWGVSGGYFAFPQPFNAVVDFLQPLSVTDKLGFGDAVLLWLSNLHIGRFNPFTEALWTVLGLVPAVLSWTGVFMCCHRIFIRKGASFPR
jgi:uncharacterized iron-regulated membrane protein